MRRIFCCLLVIVIFSGCLDKQLQNDFPDPAIREGEVDEELEDNDYNILFIGNSLTYTNDMPDMIKVIGAEKGIDIGIKLVTKPNYAIVDHWAEGAAQNQIRRGIFDFVVMQQGPSSQPEGRDLLVEGGELYKPLCDEFEADLVFYMVWPSITYYHTFDGVIRSYEMAAESSDALLCPVGREWKSHFDATEDFSYYGPDGFHPSQKGSEVAAQVIFDSLFP